MVSVLTTHIAIMKPNFVFQTYCMPLICNTYYVVISFQPLGTVATYLLSGQEVSGLILGSAMGFFFSDNYSTIFTNRMFLCSGILCQCSSLFCLLRRPLNSSWILSSYMCSVETYSKAYAYKSIGRAGVKWKITNVFISITKKFALLCRSLG